MNLEEMAIFIKLRKFFLNKQFYTIADNTRSICMRKTLTMIDSGSYDDLVRNPSNPYILFNEILPRLKNYTSKVARSDNDVNMRMSILKELLK